VLQALLFSRFEISRFETTILSQTSNPVPSLQHSMFSATKLLGLELGLGMEWIGVNGYESSAEGSDCQAAAVKFWQTTLKRKVRPLEGLENIKSPAEASRGQ
jgi:hypothetical protein